LENLIKYCIYLGFALEQGVAKRCAHRAHINLGDLTSYLTYALERRRGTPHTKREAALLAPPLPAHSPKVTLIRPKRGEWIEASENECT
jgi:hypothetical protein